MFLGESFTDKNVPGVFWLVFHVNSDERGEKAAASLAAGVLPGLKGISDSKRIVLQWLGIARNALLVMNGEETVRLNNLTRVMYDNPEYLASRDFEAVYRLFNRERDRKYGPHGLMQNLLGYLIPAVMRNEDQRYSSAFRDVAYQANYGYLSASLFGYHYEETKPRIRSVRDFAVYLKRAVREIAIAEKKHYLLEVIDKVSLEEWKAAATHALKRVGEIYGDEGEWIVKSGSFVVPEQSRLLIVRPSNTAEMARLLETIERFGLHSRYKIRFVDWAQFTQVQKRLWSKS